MQEPDFKVFSWLDEVFPLCLQKTYAREREGGGVECFWDEWFQMVLRRQPARATVFPSGTPASDTE